MESSAQGLSGRQNPIERFADVTVLVLCLSIGLTGVLASMGITVLVALAGLAGLVAWISANRPPIALPRLPLITLAALIVWAAISSLWALNEPKAFILCLRLFALCLAGLSLLYASHGYSPRIRARLNNALMAGYTLGLLALVIGFIYIKQTGDSLWGSYFNDPLTTLNNGAVIMALLLWPVAMIVWSRIHPAAAVLLVGIVASGLLFLSSGASLLSIASGLIAFVLVFAFGRPAGLAIGVIIAGLIVMAPPVMENFSHSESLKNLAMDAPTSVEHRLLMWDFVTSKIAENPLLGWGMDSSRNLPQDAFRLAPNMEIMPLHPHNAALQIRLELGWPGIIIAAALILTIFQSILNADLPKFQIAIRVAAASAYLSVGAVSYGVWQNWWIAMAWALAATVTIAIPHNSS